MEPLISEFTYGFALTNELASQLPLSVAPIFPSLIEEGRTGGGYDVKLNYPGIPLYIQFKRADKLTTRKAREISRYGLDLTLPFYRFPIMRADRSNQHAMLLALEGENTEVYYASPRFHSQPEIDRLWAARSIINNSAFIRPSRIGSIIDGQQHYIAYDETKSFLCSTPKEISFGGIETLTESLRDRLSREDSSVRDSIGNWRESLTRARKAAAEMLAAQRSSGLETLAGDFSRDTTVPYVREQDAEVSRQEVQSDGLEPQDMLRNLQGWCHAAYRDFSVQPFIVQI